MKTAIINELKKEYLGKVNQRKTKRGKQKVKSMYGLTWRGFIASIAIKDVRANILQVPERNPLSTIPEKELVLTILKELVTHQELEIIFR